MNKLLDRFRDWNHWRKLSAYQANINRLDDLKEVLDGIDPDEHPFDWNDVAESYDRLQRTCDRQAEALDLQPKENRVRT